MTRKVKGIYDAAALLCVAASALCIVMTFHSLSGYGMVGCASGSVCDNVMNGRWSRLFGTVPVSALAAGVYLALTVCLLSARFSKDEELVRTAAGLLPVFAGAIPGSAVWFVSLMIFEEGSVCRYCLAAHGMGLVESVLILVLSKELHGRWLRFGIGLALAVALAFMQFITAPDYVYQKGDAGELLPVVDAAGSPSVGDPSTADYVVELLFDYQCSHCRKVHSVLPEVVDRLGGRVAFVLCPCPLSPRCNPYVPREDVRFDGSCELAKLALALYDIDSKAFEKYDLWMFSASDASGWWPRSIEQARDYAETLVGEEALLQALDDDSIRMKLLLTYELFGRTSSGGKGGIPRFVYGEKWVVPEADSAEDIIKILNSEFGIV